MLTRRGLLKVGGALGLGSLLPSLSFGESVALAHITPSGDTQGLSASGKSVSQGTSGGSTGSLENEAMMELLDSVDCMELAERYGSFEKCGGFLGRSFFGTCFFCRAVPFSVDRDKFQCLRCEMSGTTLDFFATMEGITDEEAMDRLTVLVKSGALQRRRNEQQMLWDIMSDASGYYHHLLCNTAEGVPGQKLLEEHGVTAQVREKLGLGYFPRCPNGIRSELIEHLIGQGYESDAVQSAILPSGTPGIVLPALDPQGYCWGLLKSPALDNLPSSPSMVNDELMWGSSLVGMQHLAPHLFKKIAYGYPVGTINAVKG